jgi:two-component system, response regulator YesN
MIRMKDKYKIILVDDESDVAERISHKLEWSEIGFETPVICNNALDALEVCEKLKPEVVMTDITMPYMNGLELSRKLKNEYPNIRIIIFSGYDEFEYAQEAIHIQAEEYILKPIDSEQLKQIFTRMKSSLDKEYDERQNINKLESYYKDSLPILQESFYSSLMENKVPTDKLEHFMNNYSIDLDSPYYCAVIIHVSTHSRDKQINPLFLTVSVRKLVEEKLCEKWNGKLFTYQGNTVMIAQLDAEEGEITKLTDDCDKFARLAKSVADATVTIGIGRICSQLIDISDSYAGARLAVSYRALYGTMKAINITEIDPEQSKQTISVDSDALDEVFKRIRVNNQEGLSKAINEYLKNKTSKMTKVPEFRFFVMQLASELYGFAVSNKLDHNKIFSSYHDIILQVEKLELNDLNAWMSELCFSMQKMISEKRSNTTKNFILKAVDYVNENYTDPDLTVESICSYLNVSYAYFSTVFKKEIGKSFTSYLTELRLKKAVELLLEKDEKTYIIAHDVGYTDPNYFSYVFKKAYGVSPNKYRLKIQEEV